MKAGWRVLGASVAGTSHDKSGLPCQDAHGYRVLPGGIVLLAAADGAGSAARSAQGAAQAVETALDSLAEAVAGQCPGSAAGWEPLFAGAYARARDDVEALAAGTGQPARAFATTLLCAVVTEHGLAVAQLGDGVAVAALDGGAWVLAAEPQRGEYANETYFLTQPEALPKLAVSHYAEDTQAVVVMTDGLLRLVLDLPRGAPHVPFFSPLLSFAEGVSDDADGHAQLAAFLSSERVNARTDDDKTLVLAVRRRAPT